MEIKEDNFNYSNLKKWIEDYSHQDKVRFAIYCAELVIDIYESNNDSKAPRLAIDAAKAWVESPTEHNRKAAFAAADNAARVAYFASANYAANYAADAAADAAANAADYFAARAAADAADASAYAANYAANYAAYAADASADASAYASGDNIKSKIISWFRNSDKK